MLEITNLHKKYKDFTLDHISFRLPKGFIMGLVGKNGAGKSTTIKSIMNMLDFQGEIRVDGQDNILCEKQIKQMVGIVVDQPFFPVLFTLGQVEKYCGSFYADWDTDGYYKLLRQFGLNPKKKVNELSRGMGVKLQLAAALSHHAKLLVLDEPTSGLDPVARDECMDILMEQYVIIKGDSRKVPEELEKNLIGMRRYGDSFEAMIERERYAMCSDGLFQTENAKIDDILIYAERSA